MQRGCRRHHTTANLKTAVWSPFGTRPECGTRGISHPRNRRVPKGAPPTIRCAAGVPGGRWGSVVYGWRAPLAHPSSCLLLGFASLINSLTSGKNGRGGAHEAGILDAASRIKTGPGPAWAYENCAAGRESQNAHPVLCLFEALFALNKCSNFRQKSRGETCLLPHDRQISMSKLRVCCRPVVL